MELLEQRILTDGKVLPGGILKVDGFLNHQIDPQLLYEMALEFKRLYDGTGINKILTIEASGIAMAAMTAAATISAMMRIIFLSLLPICSSVEIKYQYIILPKRAPCQSE